jgi:hypothetical protein
MWGGGLVKAGEGAQNVFLIGTAERVACSVGTEMHRGFGAEGRREVEG